ncbi:hypothetical protein LINPERHAP1_LOCUS38962 [Linum perenne]
MARREPSESELEPEESNSDDASSEEEEQNIDKRCRNREEEEVMSEYERQRLERMAQNRARMEALGLHNMASTLMCPAVRQPGDSKMSAQRKGKRKVVEDEDYEHNQDEGISDDADDLDQSPDSDDVDDGDFVARRSSSKPQGNKNNKGSTRKGVQKKSFKVASFANEDDELLQVIIHLSPKRYNCFTAIILLIVKIEACCVIPSEQAISLSLQDSAENLATRDNKAAKEKQETTGRMKNKKSQFSSRVKMTEDDLILYFFQFDERGSGVITRRDLQRVATVHDFIWSDKELADMMNYFDGDGDGKLNLVDFRNVVGRCRMLQE